MGNIKKYEAIFKVLGDTTRLEILKVLSKQDGICVCSLVNYFDISQSKLSYHLKMLLDLNLITKERDGKWNYYKVNVNEIEKYISKEVIYSIYNEIELEI